MNSSSASKPITKYYLQPKQNWSKRNDARNDGLLRGQDNPKRSRVVTEVIDVILLNTTWKAILKNGNITKLLDYLHPTNRQLGLNRK